MVEAAHLIGGKQAAAAALAVVREVNDEAFRQSGFYAKSQPAAPAGATRLSLRMYLARSRAF